MPRDQAHSKAFQPHLSHVHIQFKIVIPKQTPQRAQFAQLNRYHDFKPPHMASTSTDWTMWMVSAANTPNCIAKVEVIFLVFRRHALMIACST